MDTDVRRAGASSLDLLDLEIELRRRTRRAVRIDAIEGAIDLAAITRAVLAAPAAVESGPDPSESSAGIPATAALAEQWLHERLHPASRAYLVPVLIPLSEPTSWRRASMAVTRLVDDHPMLRTAVVEDDTEDRGLLQRIDPSPGIVLIEPRAVLEIDDDAIRGIVDGLGEATPSIRSGRPFRAFGLQRGGRLEALLLLIHHGVVDDHSIRILVDDLGRRLRGEDAIAEGTSIATRGRREAIDADALSWWRDRLEHRATGLRLGSLGSAESTIHRRVVQLGMEAVEAIDRRMEAVDAFRSAAIVQAVRHGVERAGMAPEDVMTIGMPMSLRDDPGLDRTVGMCLNTVPLSVAANASLPEIADEIAACRVRRRVPYESIAALADRDDSARSPWLDVVVGVVEEDRGLNATLDHRVGPTLESPFPLMAIARFSTRGCALELVADPRWIDRDTFERFASAVRERLMCVAGDASIDTSIVLGPARTRRSGDLVELFRGRVREHATRPAVEGADGTILTYGELDAASESLARRISPSGGPIEEPIAIVAEPGISFCVAVLAALKVGAAAMPLAPDLPERRIERLIRSAGATRILVGDEDIAPRVGRITDRLGLRPAITVSSGAVTEPVAPVELAPDSDRACYVLFTSGSSGTPKAVRMRHGGILGLIEHESTRVGVESAVRTAQFAPLGFDVVFQELFSTWANGGVVVSIPSEVRRDPGRLRAEIDRRSITRIHLPPLMLRALAATTGDGFPDGLQEIVCAGEQLRIDARVRAAARGSSGGVRLLNQYGPTETHVVTSVDLGDDPDRWPDLPSIGTPIDGVEIRILDEKGDAVPFGGTGELVVLGDALALGYLDGPTGGFVEIGGRRAYRTGDLARLADDGSLEYLGRSDGQLKVSGYRVEPGEIEAVLASVDDVREAAVVSVETDDGNRLVAFVVAEGKTSPEEACRSACRSVLPIWMNPSAIWCVDALPRSANGKVDRAALRIEASDRGLDRISTTAGVSVRQVLETLRSDDPDPELVDRPLGTLGLDSLAAIRLQIELRERFDIDRPVATLLSTTIRDLRADGRSPRDPLHPDRADRSASPPETGEWLPLDPLARDVLAEDAMSGSGAFHLAWSIDFDRDVPIDEIRDRMRRVLEDYPTLRTCRRADRGQFVLAPGAEPVHIDRFDGEPDPQELAWLLGHRLAVAEGSPWRLATWPTSRGGRTLLVVVHHVAVDGRTASVVLDRLAGETGPIATSAASKTAALSEDAHERWWVDRLRRDLGDQGLEHVEEVRDGALEVESSRTVAVEVERSMRMATTMGMPPIVPSVVAWGILLARANGRRRAVVGVPFATDVEDAGFGTSILPVVVDAADDRDLGEVVADVSETIGLGLEHRHASLGRIVRTLEPTTAFLRPPLDGVLTRDDADRRVRGARIRWCSTNASVFRSGLMIPNTGSSAPVVLEIERSRLQGEEAASFLLRFSTLLGRVCDRIETGTTDIGSLDDRSTASTRLTEAFGAAEPVDAGGSVVERFDQIAAASPTAVAVEDATGSIDYRELQAWSNRLAGAMVDRFGPLNGRSVVLGGDRSAATVASMLAVSRAGGIFVPIESKLPTDRRRRQFEQASPVAAIGSETALADFPESIPTFDPDAARHGTEPSPGSLPSVSSEDGLYVMFTSGTTGDPRGAVVPHRAVVRLVDDPWFLPAGPGFRMLHAAPLAFDASTLEIWWPLLNGGTVCCWERTAADLPGIHDLNRRLGVRGCWLTATLFHAAVDGLPEFFDQLDLVLTGGDVVSADHVSRLLERRPGLAVVNGYGPTENTVFTACEPIVRGGFSSRDPLPIGRPVRGTAVRIVDADGRTTPLGRFGELVATGVGVGLGYLDSSGCAERRDGFDLDPITGEARYRTGDRVRWRTDGRLEFGGRIDAQVKIGGRRIELTAIDAALREDPTVRDACVSTHEHAGRSRLVGLVVPAAGEEFDAERLRSRLANRVPAWEVPAILEPTTEIPMTPNGKPDRVLVSRRFETEGGGAASAVLVDDSGIELYGVVCQCIESITGRPIQSEDTVLLESGVDSLDLLRLALELEARVARPVRLTDVLEGGTPRAIAQRIASDIEREHSQVVTLRPGASSASRSLFCIPGVGGTVFSFETILPGLPSWLSVYGLPYPGTAGTEPPLRRVEALGELFARRIRDTAPVSVIVGYSLGGFVAFETARRIAAHGPAPRVVVIDSTPAALPRRIPLASRLTSRRQWKMRLRTVLPRAIVDRIGKSDGGMLQSLRTVVAAGFDAIRAYDPSPAPLEVTLVRTAQTDFHAYRDLPDLGWGEIADRVDVVEIPCAHLEIFRAGSMELSRAVRNVVNSTRLS